MELIDISLFLLVLFFYLGAFLMFRVEFYKVVHSCLSSLEFIREHDLKILKLEQEAEAKKAASAEVTRDNHQPKAE